MRLITLDGIPMYSQCQSLSEDLEQSVRVNYSHPGVVKYSYYVCFLISAMSLMPLSLQCIFKIIATAFNCRTCQNYEYDEWCRNMHNATIRDLATRQSSTQTNNHTSFNTLETRSPIRLVVADENPIKLTRVLDDFYYGSYAQDIVFWPHRYAVSQISILCR